MNSISEQPNISFQDAIAIVLFFTAIFFLIMISRVVLSPLMIVVKEEMAFSHAAAGQLFFFLALGVSLGLLSNSVLSGLIMHRRVVILSTLLCGVALIIASFSRNFMSFAFTFFFVGWGGGIYSPSGIASITAVVDKRHWGKAMAVHETAPNLALVATPIFVEGVLLFSTWQSVLIFLGSAHILLALLFARFGKGGAFRGKFLRIAVIGSIIKSRDFWILIILFGFAFGAVMAPYAMLPLYLTDEHGFGREAANKLLSISRISGLFMAFIAGYVTDRLGMKWTLSLYLILTGLFTALLGVVHGPSLMIAAFLQPLIAVCFFPPGFTAASQLFDVSIRSITISLLLPTSVFIGNGIFPVMLGSLGERGVFYLGFILQGALILFCIVLIPLLNLSTERKL
ncbi:MAG: MFS transporter [Deltaproteobacteria bacterium]|nr:MFS transporter [Deltaproteobacteria bacterium]